tara:strand:- start:377 stop:700 length:324 start_codon:yes stop_codon:yes gene_type:complete
MKVEEVYKWFGNLTYLEQHKLTDKYFNSVNPSRLAEKQVLEIYIEEKVNDVVLDGVMVELPIKKVEVNFNGDLLAEIEIQNNTLKVLRAVNGGGYKVDCEKVSVTEK